MEEIPFHRQNTKTRILIAASRVFSEKGYDNTTVQDICTASDANIAAVNYHYKSKEKLYRTVWAYLFKFNEKENQELYRDDLDPDHQLKLFIANRVNSSFDEAELGYLSKLLFHELNTPSSSYDYIFENFIKERCAWITNLLNRLTGEKLSDAELSQVFFFVNSPITRITDTSSKGNKTVNEVHFSNPEQIIENLYAFVLAGIKALAR